MSINELKELKNKSFKDINGLVKGTNKLVEDRDMLKQDVLSEFYVTLVPKINEYVNLISDEIIEFPNEIKNELLTTKRSEPHLQILFENNMYVEKCKEIRVIAYIKKDARGNITKHIVATYYTITGSSHITIDFCNGEAEIIDNTSPYKNDNEAKIKFMEVKNELTNFIEEEFKEFFKRMSKVINRVQEDLTKEMNKYRNIICN